ncbi:hypothetical protein ASPWEDRAFT_46244 [Aspergillus wentii DTO 134E9]|uniref:CFEM domain-containing protein n=1 Tax=Aspergillus wentii DTO 134E9 TaxID=1073089 RepID=A0A1L9R6T7_ASPWE|nr:uncharacterized protein ASPWEDRAFT_46244 [Aspergillus wentii DTO 134E9]OJJ30631.1 hypothetical protein ASPWEDRAFT_46244 [Aspergillus wentii DTO 134E9]
MLLPIAAILGMTAAQSSCVTGCLTTAGSATGCSDKSCACSNENFKKQALDCVQQKCSDADVTAAKDLQKQC